jgi:hypothetical protein
MRRPLPPAVAALAAVVVGAAVAPAALASEDDRAFSLFAGYGRFTVPDRVADGGVLGVDYERGLTDAVSLRASAGGGLYASDGLAYSGQAVLGITYLFDVLRYVPYANLGVGAIVMSGDTIDTTVEPLVELGLGLDILQSRETSWGVQVRYETLTNEPSYLTAGLRLTWRWGFF